MKFLDGNSSIHLDAYKTVDPERLTLRDFLAIDRTSLSNQNTFLAYVRTALTLFVAGLSFIKFFDERIIEWIGWIFVPLGVATFIIGTIRYNKIRTTLAKLGTELIASDQPGQSPD